MGEGGGSKENTADRRSGIAGVSGVSGPRFDSRQGTFFLLFVRKMHFQAKTHKGGYIV